MKNLILTLMMLLSVEAIADCNTARVEKVDETREDVNTPVPRGLEGAQIILKTKDGRTSVMNIEQYKIVPRRQQFKVSMVRITSKMTCSVAKESTDNNTLILGVRKDHTGLDIETSSTDTSSTAKVLSKRDAVLDVSYLRRKAVGNIGVGAGVDTNGTLKGMIGIDF